MYHSNSSFLVQTKQHETSTMLRESSAAATTPVTIRTYSSISPPIVFFRHYSCNTCAAAAPAANDPTIEAVTGTKNHIFQPSFPCSIYHLLLMQHIRRHCTSHKRSCGCSSYRYVKPHIQSLLSQVFSALGYHAYWQRPRKQYRPKSCYRHHFHPPSLIICIRFLKTGIGFYFFTFFICVGLQ